MPAASQHLERRHALDAKTDARVRDLDLLGRSRCDLVRYDRVPVGQRVRHEVVVGDLEEGAHRGRLVVLTGSPSADRATLEDRGIRLQEEAVAASGRPSGELIGAGLDFVADLLDAEDPSRGIALQISQSQNAGQKSKP